MVPSSRHKFCLNLLQDIIRIPSLSGEEKNVVDYLEHVCKAYPVDCKRVDDNLIVSVGTGEETLLLNTHSDVVPPSPNHYGNPFDPVIEGERLYGRGSTDAGASLAGMLTAFLEYSTHFPLTKGKVVVAITACEEALGAKNGAKLIRNQGLIPRIDAVVIGEPTELKPCIAQKGLGVVKAHFRGKSGHAARISKGENVLFEVGEWIQALKEWSIDVSNAWVGETKVTPTVIHGGTANNMAPEEITLTLDARLIPEVPLTQVLALLPASPNLSFEIISDRFVPVETSPHAKIAHLCAQVSGQSFFGSPTCSDWVAFPDIPTIKIGPGKSEDSHTHNESVALSQLFEGADFYYSLIQTYFEQ